MAPIRLGDLLVKAKVITDDQLKAALLEQSRYGGHLGEILVQLNIVSEEMLVKALSKQMSVPAVNLEQVPSISNVVRGKVPSQVANELKCVPLQLRDEGKTLVVAMLEPQNLKHLDTLRSVSGCRIVPQIAGARAIARAYGRFYDGAADLAEPSGPLKMSDAQNMTYHTLDPVASAPPQARRSAAPPAPAPRAPSNPSMPQVADKTPGHALRVIEEAQRKEVAALKAMVEILIEKGVFSRDEYLARIKNG